jgi:tellurite methyltransferase
VTLPGKVLDLGGGSLNDAKYLLHEGFSVTVVDAEPDVIRKSRSVAEGKLTCICSAFDQFPFPKKQYDLVSAMYALPFNPPKTFPSLMKNIIESLSHGGVMCIHLYGIRDSWNIPGTRMTFLEKNEIDRYLKPLNILYYAEEESDTVADLDGKMHHWHIYSIIAQSAKKS